MNQFNIVMKANEIKEFSVEDIEIKITEETKRLSEYKLNHVVAPLDNPLVIKETRKLIARLQTELNSRK